MRQFLLNGHKVEGDDIFRDHKIKLPRHLLNQGENEVRIRFVSTYTRDCEGIHYFKDQDDDEEYLYSQFEAACAHKVFPCFDQPDLKAPYSLLIFAPKDWVVVSTTKTKSVTSKTDE